MRTKFHGLHKQTATCRATDLVLKGPVSQCWVGPLASGAFNRTARLSELTPKYLAGTEAHFCGATSGTTDRPQAELFPDYAIPRTAPAVYLLALTCSECIEDRPHDPSSSNSSPQDRTTARPDRDCCYFWRRRRGLWLQRRCFDWWTTEHNDAHNDCGTFGWGLEWKWGRRILSTKAVTRYARHYLSEQPASRVTRPHHEAVVGGPRCHIDLTGRWLLSDDPCLGQFIGSESAVGTGRTVQTVGDSPVVNENLGIERWNRTGGRSRTHRV
jgi:hypothetical protein